MLRWTLMLGASLSLVGCASSYELLTSPDAGRDASLSLDAGTDLGSDATMNDPACAPQRFHVCGHECAEPELPKFYWDGTHCTSVCRGDCIGDDCDNGFATEGECMNAHASCEPVLCAATGGVYINTYVCDTRCGIYSQALECDYARHPCLCEPGKSFDPTHGCIVDASCTTANICRASGGVPRGNGDGGAGLAADYYECGVNLADGEMLSASAQARITADIDPGCDCGPGGTASSTTHRCEPDASCRARSSLSDQDYAASLCTAAEGMPVTTGGDRRCGMASDTGTYGCDCGPTSIFDGYRCAVSESCMGLALGENCASGSDEQCAFADTFCDAQAPFQGAYTCSVHPLVCREAHVPVCRHDSDAPSGRGWYWADTDELICNAICSPTTAANCPGPGDVEGWYSDSASAGCSGASSTLILAADCAR